MRYRYCRITVLKKSGTGTINQWRRQLAMRIIIIIILIQLRLVALLLLCGTVADALNLLLPGGTGPVGKLLASKLPQHDVTILARNAFLAATPSRVSEDYGWVGAGFLKMNRHVKLRDWDGGDLLDIVGMDWMGWQDDALKTADCVVHLTGGGFTQQRVMACERLVRESLSANSDALHITVNPTEELLAMISPGMPSIKRQRIQTCEDMVKQNCRNHVCLRLDERKVDDVCETILAAIGDWEKSL